MSGQPKPSWPVLELCNHAAAELKRAGFELRYVSQRSEACYYALPGRPALLRIATHRFDRKTRQFFQHSAEVVAFLTFRGTCLSGPNEMRLAVEKRDDMIAQAIGRYMLKSAPREGRPMIGLWATLTPEQKVAALSYDGPEHLGDPTVFRPPAQP